VNKYKVGDIVKRSSGPWEGEPMTVVEVVGRTQWGQTEYAVRFSHGINTYAEPDLDPVDKNGVAIFLEVI
jgi:hypothetical protein